MPLAVTLNFAFADAADRTGRPDHGTCQVGEGEGSETFRFAVISLAMSANTIWPSAIPVKAPYLVEGLFEEGKI